MLSRCLSGSGTTCRCFGMSDSGGGPGGGGEEGGMEVSGSAVQNVADVSVLQKHLRKLVPLLLEDGGEAPAALEAALEEKGAVEHMRKFLSDPQVHTVLVERSTLKGERDPGPRGGRDRGGGGASREADAAELSRWRRRLPIPHLPLQRGGGASVTMATPGGGCLAHGTPRLRHYGSPSEGVVFPSGPALPPALSRAGGGAGVGCCRGAVRPHP